MKCPICGTENKPGARNCKCGFFLVLENNRSEVETNARKHNQLETERMKYCKAMFMGMLWTVAGIVLSIIIYCTPKLPQDYRVRFVFLGFIVIVYGLFEIVRCHIKIRNIIEVLVRSGKKKSI
ncbi:MAG: hypothetical protein K8T10_00380 [Candidatus Eremiobacteraeota bacterium]|nr:hypothetical protein [Candidatus Eremiobacteraeota bacterium]